MDENTQELYYEAMEKQENKKSFLSYIPVWVYVIFGLVLVFVISFIFKDADNSKSLYIACGIVALIIILIAFQGRGKDQKEWLGEREIVPLAIIYLKEKIEILRENYNIYDKGVFYLTGITCLREWDGVPWRWYIYFECKEEGVKSKWFGFVFDPYNGKCKGTEKYDSERKGTEIPHVRPFIPFQVRQNSKYKGYGGM